MKIETTSGNIPSSSTAQVQPRPISTEEAAVQAAPSQPAQVVSSVRTDMASVRAARVANIAASVRQGRYSVDPDKVAGEMVDSADLEAAMTGAEQG
jgi:anti-sigma28 factor (negative regulator of flagellin synthesis)